MGYFVMEIMETFLIL